ncbi:hypothetical protein E4T56_gene1956, partial [Termitomyces sp. T112]
MSAAQPQPQAAYPVQSTYTPTTTTPAAWGSLPGSGMTGETFAGGVQDNAAPFSGTPQAPVDPVLAGIERDIAGLAQDNGPRAEVDTSFRARKGEAGLSQMSEMKASAQLSTGLGRGRVFARAEAVVIDAGRPTGSGLARFGRNATIEAQAIVDKTASALINAETQRASGVAMSAGYADKLVQVEGGTTPVGMGETKATWRVGFDADVGPRSMLYGNISTGYKAGGFSAGPTPGLTPGLTVDPALVPLLTYKPEELTSYELGIKNSFLDRRLQTIFLFPLPSLPPVIVPSVVNAGAGKTYGADLDITYRFSSHDQIGVSLEVLGSKYDNFVYPFLFTSGLNQDKSGRPFNYAPSLSGSVDYSHVWDLANGGNVTLRAGVRFSASYWMSYNYDSASRQGAYSKTDLSLEYAAPEHAWFARAWVRNLENSAVLSYVGGSVP